MPLSVCVIAAQSETVKCASVTSQTSLIVSATEAVDQARLFCAFRMTPVEQAGRFFRIHLKLSNQRQGFLQQIRPEHEAVAGPQLGHIVAARVRYPDIGPVKDHTGRISSRCKGAQ